MKMFTHQIAAKCLVTMVAVSALGLAACRTNDTNSAAKDEGGISSVGFPAPMWFDGSKGVFIQEYWVGSTPYYAIANTRGETATIQAAMSAGKKIGTPWTVNAGSIANVKISNLELPAKANGEPNGLTFFLNDSHEHDLALGSLYAPMLPASTSKSLRTSVRGLNNQSLMSAVPSLALSTTPVTPGHTGTAHLKLADGAGNLVFGVATDTRNAVKLPLLTVLSASSSTLTTSASDGVVTITNPSYESAQAKATLHDVDITYKVPENSKLPMAELCGSVNDGSGGCDLSFGVEIGGSIAK